MALQINKIRINLVNELVKEKDQMPLLHHKFMDIHYVRISFYFVLILNSYTFSFRFSMSDIYTHSRTHENIKFEILCLIYSPALTLLGAFSLRLAPPVAARHTGL